MTRPDVSVKGYYYNLDKSPYVWTSPYGDSFKLPSAKRLEMMDKRCADALGRLDKLLDCYDLKHVLPDDLSRLLARYIIKAVYQGIIGD